MRKNKIVEETTRESIINRPHNLAGSVKKITKERFNITEDSIEYKSSSTIPALLKLFMESLDNPIDVAIKGGCTKIDIQVTPTTIQVKDDGYGISTLEGADGETDVFKAFCKYNTSTNYGENRGQGQKGVNGIGIKLCTTLSSWLTAEVEDEHSKVVLKATDNNLNHSIKTLKKTGKTGVSVTFSPDFKLFDTKEIDEVHMARMYEYVLFQSLTYPDIKFTFNKKLVRYTPKKFISMLNESHIVETYEDFFIAIVPNYTEEFKQISYVNGLETSKGGTHVDYITDSVVNKLREKIIKKYKTIKPGDIKSKITVIIIAKNVKEIDWDGQTKESITTPRKYFIDYFSEIDFDKLSNKVYKTQDIINPIIDYFKIKEEFKKNQELKGLDKKPSKKPKDDKFLSPVGDWDNILLCEGDCLEENTELLDENFKPKKIKDFRQDDLIISGDGSIQKIESVTKSLRDMVYIKTKSGMIECSRKHRWYVYNKNKREFEFENAGVIVENSNNYNMVKSRTNKDLHGTKVLDNIDNFIYCDNGNIEYTSDDYFLIYRNDNFERIHAKYINKGDTILFT